MASTHTYLARKTLATFDIFAALDFQPGREKRPASSSREKHPASSRTRGFRIFGCGQKNTAHIQKFGGSCKGNTWLQLLYRTNVLLSRKKVSVEYQDLQIFVHCVHSVHSLLSFGFQGDWIRKRGNCITVDRKLGNMPRFLSQVVFRRFTHEQNRWPDPCSFCGLQPRRRQKRFRPYPTSIRRFRVHTRRVPR